MNRNLTFNLGLRYDYNTTWNVAHNDQQQFITPRRPSARRVRAPIAPSRIDLLPGSALPRIHLAG